MLSLSNHKLLAQQTFGSVEALWKYVDEHNVHMSFARTQRAMTIAQTRQAKRNFLPAVSLNGAFTDNVSIQPTLVPAELFGGEPGTFVEEQFGKRYIYNGGLNAQWDIVNTEDWFALKSAHLDESLSELQWRIDQKDIYTATSNAYFTYCLMLKSEAITTESLNTAERIQVHAANQYAHGQISKSVFNMAQAQVKSSAMALITVWQNKRSALNELKQLLNLSASDSLLLTENLSLDSLNVAPPTLWSSEDINVELSHMQVAKAKNVWQASKASYAPTLSVVYSYSLQITGNSFLNFSDANHLPQQYWGVRVAIPLLAHGNRSFQEQKARLEYEYSQLNLKSTMHQASLSDDNLIHDLRQAREKVQIAEELLALHDDNDAHAAWQLEVGQISLDSRLRVYQDYIAYKNEYLATLAEFYMQYATLKVRQQPFENLK